MSIIAPPDYVGNIMPMCQDRRGIFKDMQYLDSNLVELHYSMPIGEIIYDFFDALKARTKGTPVWTTNWRAMKERPGKGGPAPQRGPGGCPELHCPPRKAYGRARKICEKLKENIPPSAVRGADPGSHRR